jgi:hypothetical protein
MKRFVVAVMACGVWLAGAASAATLAHVLRRPLAPPTALAEIVPSRAVPRLDPAFQVALPGVIAIPPITIVGRRAVVAPRVAPAPAPVVRRDITEMNCADWRDLEMGSGRVRICQ